MESGNNLNKMHLEKFKEMMSGLQPDEMEVVINEITRKHPELVLKSLENYIFSMQNSINAFEGLVRGVK